MSANRLGGLAALVLALVLSATPASAQVNTADARTFLGEWDVTFQGDQPIALLLTIRDQESKLAATANMMGTDVQITQIQKQQTALVLNYTFDYQGMPVPISITLTPGEQGVVANLSAMGGQFTVAGTAKKR